MKVLDFYADWCNPCKSLAPILEKVVEEKGLPIEKINIEEDEEDENGETQSSKYNVRNIPTVIIVDENNEEVKRFTGIKHEHDLREFFNF